MKTILQQQVELELGDSFPEYHNRAERFINTLSVKPWFTVKRKVIFNNEGGIGEMVLNCLVRVIEKNDFDEGLKAYAQYLADEYQTTNHRSRVYHTKVKLFGDNIPPDTSGDSIENFLDSLSTPEGIEHPKGPLIEKCLRTSEEVELFTALASVNNNLRTAAELIGLSLKDAKRVWYRIYQRARTFPTS